MYTAAIVTVSDRAFGKTRTDTSGPLISEYLKNAGYDVVSATVVPDEQAIIENELIKLCDNICANLVITTGGTGFSKRDVTPEATIRVCEKLAGGISDAVRSASIDKNPRAILSRAVAGIRNETIIINLPGNPNAAWECLQAVLPVIPHGIDVLTGRISDCQDDK